MMCAQTRPHQRLLMNPSTLTALATALTLFGLPLHAQDSSCLHRTIIANVVDAMGNPVPGLTAADFQARFRGKSVRIISARFDQQPRRIVLLLDASGSMMETKKWDFALKAARDFVTQLSADSSIAMMTFAEKVEERTEFSQGKAAIFPLLDKLKEGKKVLPKAHRNAALWDALEESLRSFQPPHFGDSLFVITDGGENKSNSNLRHLNRALLSKGVRFPRSISW
jgi:von Willebrand factor type A domain